MNNTSNRKLHHSSFCATRGITHEAATLWGPVTTVQKNLCKSKKLVHSSTTRWASHTRLLNLLTNDRSQLQGLRHKLTPWGLQRQFWQAGATMSRPPAFSCYLGSTWQRPHATSRDLAWSVPVVTGPVTRRSPANSLPQAWLQEEVWFPVLGELVLFLRWLYCT